MKYINPLTTAGSAHLLVLGILILPLVGHADPGSRKKRAFRTIVPVTESFGVLGGQSAPAENTALARSLDQAAVAPQSDPAPAVPVPQPAEPAVSLSTDFSAGSSYPATVDFRIPPPPVPEENTQVVMLDSPGGAPPRIELETANPVVPEPISQPVDESQLLAATASATRVEESPDNISAANPYYSTSESAPKPSVTKPSPSKKSSSTKSASTSRSSGSSTFFNSRNSRFRSSSSRRSSSSCRGGV